MRRLSLLFLASCGPRLVTVVPTDASMAPVEPSFEVIPVTGGVKDPLPVNGADVAYAGLERALGVAVMRAVRPKHDHTLTVELVAARAEYVSSRLSVSMVARATLRAREGNAFVAQTQIVCRDDELVRPEAGASVVTSCMAALGRDLGGWMEAQ